MNLYHNYFKYILGELIPELNVGKLKLIPSNGARTHQNQESKIADKTHSRKLIYIKGGDLIEKISIWNELSFEVQVDIDKADHFYKELNILKSQLQIIAHFSSSKKPAILYYPEDRTLYFFFDFEKLVNKLSMLEDEWGKVDRHGRFLANFHTAESRWKFPILEIMGKLIRDTFGFLNNEKKGGIIITHDVDRVGLEPFLFFKNILHLKPTNSFAFNGGKKMLSPVFDTLININSKYNIKPIWFLLSGNYSFRRYGNRYSLESNKAKKLMALLKVNKEAIGLHTSYYAAFNTRKCFMEKECLENIYGLPIIINRNHYLRFDIRKSIHIYEHCGFIADTTIGYSDANGFRAGICRLFHLWNYKTEKISDILEAPLLFMDSVHQNDLAESWNDIKRVLYWIKKMRGYGTILFHPDFFASSQENLVFYESFIKESQRLNISFLSIEDVLASRKPLKSKK